MIEKLDIQGAFIIRPSRHHDDRGFFQELYNQSKFDNLNIDCDWKQVNYSQSKKNVVRGLHCAPFSKLCTCISGSLFDVFVDFRESSPTYLKWCGVWLDSEKSTQVYIPAGCGHGFYSAEDNTCLIYLQTDFYKPNAEKSYAWDKYGIIWPEADEYILSEKDSSV